MTWNLEVNRMITKLPEDKGSQEVKKFSVHLQCSRIAAPPRPPSCEEGYTSQASEEGWRRRVCVGIKIEAGNTVTEPVPSLEPGAWYSLSWLWCGDTFLGVEPRALQ